MTKYVVAVSQAEADSLVECIGHDTRADAEYHLKYVKEPPTDPFYAAMYRVYEVQVVQVRETGRL